MKKTTSLLLITSSLSVFANETNLVEKTESAFQISGFASFEVATDYVSFGSRSNDDPCYWTYAEFNIGYEPFGSIGASLWQNTDMTTVRKDQMRRMNEWDWIVYYRNDCSFTDDWKFNYEVGHIWYKYHGLNGHEMRKAYATMKEVYVRSSLDNPFVTPYIFATYDYAVTEGFYFEGGLKKEISITDELSFTPNFLLGGGSDKYLSVIHPPWGGTGDCLSHVQLSGTLAYWFNEHFGIHAMLGYVVIVNDEIRGAIDDEGNPYSKNYVWATVGVDFAF